MKFAKIDSGWPHIFPSAALAYSVSYVAVSLDQGYYSGMVPEFYFWKAKKVSIMHLPLPEKQQKKRKDMSNASWKQGIMYLQRLLSHTIWKSLKKFHSTRFDKKLLPAFRGTLTTYLASTFPFHNSFISYDSTCTSWDQIDTFDIKFSKSSKILLRHFWWFSNTVWEQAKEEWEEERGGGGRGSKVCKLAKMRVVAFSLLTLLSATQYWR